jgi:hypothetical protein
MARLIILLVLLFDGAMMQFLAGCAKEAAPPPAPVVAPAPPPPEPAPAPQPQGERG